MRGSNGLKCSQKSEGIIFGILKDFQFVIQHLKLNGVAFGNNCKK
jgi:hypothetical protein